MKSYKYLGSIVSGANSIEEEIRERIALGSKAYYANKKIFKRELVSKKAELKLYWTVIRPVITCLQTVGTTRIYERIIINH